jgi:hypothetical protein
VPGRRLYAVDMLVEGTLRWKVTEDCPWDLVVALCLRDLAGLGDLGEPPLPPVTPALQRAPARRVLAAGAPTWPQGSGRRAELAAEWNRWWRQTAAQAHMLPASYTAFVPPHFAAFDRDLELQDLVIEHFDAAATWATQLCRGYVSDETLHHADYAADIGEIVRTREHELRRQAGSFRLNIEALPLAEQGAWVVGSHTVVISWSLRDDRAAFRRWFEPLVVALV